MASKRPRLPARRAAIEILTRLRDAGHTAYFAGGCVRDALLGLKPKDYDIATDATPDAVLALFPRARPVGEAFGVVLARHGGHPVEIATFRAEAGYSDKRRPDHVTFTDAQHDAQRRDFTINGLFADPLNTDPHTGGDRIIDYVGGRDDLHSKLVRAIGDPTERFAEDYLRMLRAPRFAARFDFQIEHATAAAIRPLAQHLGEISRERIGQELLAMFTAPHAPRAATLIEQLTLDGPALNEPHARSPLQTLSRLPATANYPTRLAGWMLDRHIASPSLHALPAFVPKAIKSILPRWRNALCLSNDHRDRLRDLLQAGASAAAWDELPVAARKRLLAREAWADALNLLRALPPAQRVEQIQAQARPLLAEGVAPVPLITGDDLIAMGLSPGPAFKRILDAAYDAQLEHRLSTREHALQWVREHHRQLGQRSG